MFKTCWRKSKQSVTDDNITWSEQLNERLVNKLKYRNGIEEE